MEKDLSSNHSINSKKYNHTPIYKTACVTMLAGAMLFTSGLGTPAFADGYVSGDNNNLYYGYKTDAEYSAVRLLTEVQFYDTPEDARKGDPTKQNPMGRYVRVHYYSNDPEDVNSQPDSWALRPSWWFGVPKGLENVQHIKLIRKERVTHSGGVQVKRPEVVGGKDRRGYTVVTANEYAKPSDFESISRYHYDANDRVNNKKIAKVWNDLIGFKHYDDNGNTKQQWPEFQDNTQSIFVDWESSGTRSYDFTYIAKISDKFANDRVNNPLYFTAGIYRPVGNWHYATGKAYYMPKASDHIRVNYPNPTEVMDLTQVSPTEKEQIIKAIKDVNKGKAGAESEFSKYLKESDGIVINNDGSAKITFIDGSYINIPSKLLVKQGKKYAEKYSSNPVNKTGVVKMTKLTPQEREAVKKAIIDSNKANGEENEFLKHLKKNAGEYSIEIEENGDAHILFQDDSRTTIPSSELIYQGETIADWAPYCVPDPIEVANISKLEPGEITEIIKAFDNSNKDLPVYQDAKNGDKSPVTINPNGDAVITWKDGSSTTIPSYLFLKEKVKQVPTPKPPVKTEKEFNVDLPSKAITVNFDPFNAKPEDLEANKTQLDNVKMALKNLKAKDAEDNNTNVPIKDVEFDFVNGKVIFKADGYNDRTYPMGMFLKQRADKQTPKETEHNPAGKAEYKYKVAPVEYTGNAPTPQDWQKALKAFVKSNYGVDVSNEPIVETYSLPSTLVPVAGTQGMNVYKNGENNNAGVVTIGISPNHTDGTLQVQGYTQGDNNLKTLFTVPADQLYKKQGVQTDHTLSDLKALAKQLVKDKHDAGVTDEDFEKFGIGRSDDNTINSMTEDDLRDFIKKVSEAKHIEQKRQYKTNPVEVEDYDNLSVPDELFKKALKQFLKANYDGSVDALNIRGTSFKFVTRNGSDWVNNNPLTPKDGVLGMKLASENNPKGIASAQLNNDGVRIDFCDIDGKVLFSLEKDELYKKAPTPIPQDQLNKMKDEAKKLIDKNAKLTDQQKTDFDKRITDADSIDKIREILKEANQQADNNHVTSDDINNKQNTEKQKAKEEAKQKDDNDSRQKQKEETEKEKNKANAEIGSLNNLSDEDKEQIKKKLNGEPGKNNGAQSPEEVQKILDEAKAKDSAKKAIKDLSFIDHGKGEDADVSDPNHKEDAALKELLNKNKSNKDDALNQLEDILKSDTESTPEKIAKAVENLTRKNAENMLNAKQNAKVELGKLSHLTKQQREEAENKINNATKPSDVKKAIDDAKTLDKSNKDKLDNKRENDNKEQADKDKQALKDEKQKAKEDLLNIPGLTDEEKKAANEEIDNATHKGDAIAVVNRSKKQKKIRDTLAEIAKLEHLNDNQKATFENIIKQSDGTDHLDDSGQPTGKDDIDDALDQALKLNGAMKRLSDLDKIANQFKESEKYKNLDINDGQQKAKKQSFDSAFARTDANENPNQPGVLNKKQGDNLGLAQVNDLYKELLEAMKAIDPAVQGAGLYVSDLQKEYDADNKLKSDKDPKYENASQGVKDAFDEALNNVKTLLDEVTKPGANTDQQTQDKINDAYAKLVEARQHLDGVDKSGLKSLVDDSPTVKNSVAYVNADVTKQRAYDKAISDGLTVLQKAGASENEVKQAIDAINNAKSALDGVDKSELQKAVSQADKLKSDKDPKYENASQGLKDAFDKALQKATEVLNKKTATADEISDALSKLNAAKQALNGKATGSAPAGKSPLSKNAKLVKSNRFLENTGADVTSTGLFASMFALVGAWLVSLKRRRNKHE